MQAPVLSVINSRLAFIILACLILYFGSFVLIPFTFSVLLAMLMAPVANFLERKKLSRLVSASICTFILFVFFSLFIYLITAEIANLLVKMPAIQVKFKTMLQNLQSSIHSLFRISPEEQLSIIRKQTEYLFDYAGDFLTAFISQLSLTMGSILLTFVLFFLFLLQRERYERFILSIFGNGDPLERKKLLRKINKVAGLYLRGRVISILILTFVYSIGLSIIGIENAFLLSAFAALLSIVPYIGTFIGGIFPVLMTLVTEPGWFSAIWVTMVMILGQLIDDYFIEPVVVGGQVDLSAVSVLLIIITGGYLWGFSGMILFIPLLAIVKIICDEVDTLKPYGLILGQKHVKTESKLLNFFKGRKK